MSDDADSNDRRPRLRRRSFLLGGGGVAAAGAVGAVALDRLLSDEPSSVEASSTDEEANGRATIAFHGRHQAGIEMRPQAQQSLVAFDLKESTSKDDLIRLLKVLTDDAAKLTQGVSALADSEPELTTTPARLTITFGFGPKVVEIARGRAAVPSWLAPLPAYSIDRLQDDWSGGDLLLQIATDDPITLAHVSRMLVKDTRSFATVRWNQTGFRNSYGSYKATHTMRNQFGQVDGTVNPEPGSARFADVVWRKTADDGEGWLVGGTTMVIRRIMMEQDKWDLLDRDGREEAVGRRLSNGAPLTGTREHDEPDFKATTPLGFPVIAEFSHIRRARGDASGPQLLRRGYNYDLGPDDTLASRAGLIFTTFQRDLAQQYLPIQERLAKLDLLNQWTVPIGSAVFAIPGGVRPGEFVGQALFVS